MNNGHDEGFAMTHRSHVILLSIGALLTACAHTGEGDERAIENAWNQAKGTLVGTPLKTLDSCAKPAISTSVEGVITKREYFSSLAFYGGMSSMTCTLEVQAKDGVVERFTTKVTSTGGAPRSEFTCAYPIEACLTLPKPFDLDAKVSYSPTQAAAYAKESSGLVGFTLALSQASATMLGMKNPGQYSTDQQGGETRTYGKGGRPIGASGSLLGNGASNHVASNSSRPVSGQQPAAAAPDIDAAIARAQAIRANTPRQIDGCNTGIDHLRDRLPICSENEGLVKMRRLWLLADGSFKENLAAGATLEEIATTQARLAREFEGTLKVNEELMQSTAADGQRARQRILALKETPSRCDAGPQGAFGMQEQAYQAYVNSYMAAQANRALSAIAACRARAKK